MALLGQAALAMWWDMAPDRRAEFEDWHSHEHFPERLALPGFLRASRWADADGGPGFFVMYELASPATLASPEYLARLNAPSPWSTQLMPHHRNMVRSQCEVVASNGAATGAHVLTLRLSPVQAGEARLRQALDEQMRAFQAPGGIGVHLLRHRPPAIAPTLEQKIRGLADQAADWVFVVSAYDLQWLRDLRAAALGDVWLEQAGAQPGVLGGLYTLRLAMVPGDLA